MYPLWPHSQTVNLMDENTFRLELLFLAQQILPPDATVDDVVEAAQKLHDFTAYGKVPKVN